MIDFRKINSRIGNVIFPDSCASKEEFLTYINSLKYPGWSALNFFVYLLHPEVKVLPGVKRLTNQLRKHFKSFLVLEHGPPRKEEEHIPARIVVTDWKLYYKRVFDAVYKDRLITQITLWDLSIHLYSITQTDIAHSTFYKNLSRRHVDYRTVNEINETVFIKRPRGSNKKKSKTK
ncbi:hypothetical protein SDC9_24986 [bioreactor metagenome]|uniref:Uncharacterized protein n=1 Tax=bioreactor metagenome TaxID=1076179 RepID=A0A644UJP4_9ZZZZ